MEEKVMEYKDGVWWRDETVKRELKEVGKEKEHHSAI